MKNYEVFFNILKDGRPMDYEQDWKKKVIVQPSQGLYLNELIISPIQFNISFSR